MEPTPPSFIPFSVPSIGEEEVREVADTLRSGWLTTGPKTSQFESEFTSYVGAACALAVNSGTAALHLALAGLGIGPGDEVITTPLTFCATVNAIQHVGATPVLADVGVDGNIDPDSIASRITSRTKALLPVHLAGLPCQMERIWELAQRHRLHVVEDAAHAVATKYHGRMVGGDSRSDAVAFSFYANKNLTTGEGGMVTTFDPKLLETMRMLCLHGISKDAWNRYSESGSWRYQVVRSGFKYNISDIQSAIGIHQLRKQEQFLAARTRCAELYNELFSQVEEVEVPPVSPDCRHAWHLYILRLRLEALSIDRDEFICALHRQGIGVSVHYIPIQLHPFFSEYACLPWNNCPRSLAFYPRLISLPLYPAMTEEQVRRTAGAVCTIARAASKNRALAAVA
jgi:dTDP-4-amino-4,6-dideoxygalactose transaminase